MIKSRATDNAENVQTVGQVINVTVQESHLILTSSGKQGTVICDPNPVPDGENSTCTTTPNHKLGHTNLYVERGQGGNRLQTVRERQQQYGDKKRVLQRLSDLRQRDV